MEKAQDHDKVHENNSLPCNYQLKPRATVKYCYTHTQLKYKQSCQSEVKKKTSIKRNNTVLRFNRMVALKRGEYSSH